MSKLKRKFGKRMKYNYKRTFFVLFLFLLLGSFGLAYSYLTTNLSIDGTSNVKSAKWDVHFDNAEPSEGSVMGAVNYDNTTASFTVTLANPGEYFEFTIDLINAGTLNAKIAGMNVSPILTEEQQQYFSYTVSYVNGTEIRENDGLDAGVTRKIKVRVEYLMQADSSLYPSDDDNIDFSVSIDIIQGTGEPVYDYPSLSLTFNGDPVSLPPEEPVTMIVGEDCHFVFTNCLPGEQMEMILGEGIEASYYTVACTSSREIVFNVSGLPKGNYSINFTRLVNQSQMNLTLSVLKAG